MEQTDKERRDKIAQILREGITFSGQVGDYVIHGAIDELMKYFEGYKQLKAENEELKREKTIYENRPQTGVSFDGAIIEQQQIRIDQDIAAITQLKAEKEALEKAVNNILFIATECTGIPQYLSRAMDKIDSLLNSDNQKGMKRKDEFYWVKFFDTKFTEIGPRIERPKRKKK